MRLLNVHTLEFEEFVGTHTPRYAIASHRWYMDEPTIEAFITRCNTDSDGYKKVEQFCRFTQRWDPDIRWLWIDTCCVDKKSSAELQEVINSMFRWYSNAEVCFAFLHDVRSTAMGWRTLLGDLQRSVWFNRGWTLQELLAPQTVVFLNEEWEVIGHKGQFSSWPTENNLNEYVAATTGIPEDVLVDYNHSKSLSCEARMAWVATRTTTRTEDKAYCLLGIFDLYMPLIYGEGDKAHARLLAEIRKSQPSNAGTIVQRQPPGSRIPMAAGTSLVDRRRGNLPLQTKLPRDLPPPIEKPKIEIASFATKLPSVHTPWQRPGHSQTRDRASKHRRADIRNIYAQVAKRQPQTSTASSTAPNHKANDDTYARKAASPQHTPSEDAESDVGNAADLDQANESSDSSSSHESNVNCSPHPSTRISKKTHSAILYTVEEAIRKPSAFTPEEQEEDAQMGDVPLKPRWTSAATVGEEDEIPIGDPAERFPHAFERWETLSAHWEGLTSYWLHKLDQNTEAIRTTVPDGNAMSRQITDLSAAGANLFHAVVELQRLRASSERKFQRWFFETKADHERNSEVIGELQRALELERAEKELCLQQLKEIQQPSECANTSIVHEFAQHPIST